MVTNFGHLHCASSGPHQMPVSKVCNRSFENPRNLVRSWPVAAPFDRPVVILTSITGEASANDPKQTVSDD